MAQQFQVPQFIEVEDKLFGPLTFKQFAYLAGGAGLGYIAFALMPNFTSGVVAAAPFVALALALAFLKIQDRPFPVILEAAVKYAVGKKLYLWHQRDDVKPQEIAKKAAFTSKPSIPRISESRLHNLSWSIGVRNEGNGRGKVE